MPGRDDALAGREDGVPGAAWREVADPEVAPEPGPPGFADEGDVASDRCPEPDAPVAAVLLEDAAAGLVVPVCAG